VEDTEIVEFGEKTLKLDNAVLEILSFMVIPHPGLLLVTMPSWKSVTQSLTVTPQPWKSEYIKITKR
jgi:hypothetical protein